MEKLTRLQILASHLKGAVLYVYHNTPFYIEMAPYLACHKM